MPDTDDEHLKTVKVWVWSGFYDPEEVDELIDGLLEDHDSDDHDEEQAGEDHDGEDDDGAVRRRRLCAAAGAEFAAKAAGERAWPAVTDCDRLDDAFDALEALGVIALQNVGYTLSDGIADVNGEYLDRGLPDEVTGYCFYHGQDLERAVAGGGLMIAFGQFDDAPGSLERTGAVGRVVKEALERHGFAVTWDGDPDVRLEIAIDWKRRGPGPD